MITNKIRAIIVDDEAIARETLQSFVTKYCPQVDVIASADNIKTAVPLIHELQPQLLFLDVEMPYGNAFDVLEACQDVSFETIFITAFSEYSLKALNMSAAYYILKPIDIEELITAVHKVQQIIQNNVQLNRNKILLANLKEEVNDKKQVIIPTMEGFEVLKVEQILRLQAHGNYTDIFLVDGRKKVVCRLLKHFDDLLGSSFTRIHRSHIINLNHVIQYSKGAGGSVMLSDRLELEVSSSYKDDFLKRLGAF